MFEFLGIAYSPDTWFQTLLPHEHFFAILIPQGTAPTSQKSPMTPRRSSLCWVTIFPASEKFRNFRRGTEVNLKNLSVFHRNTIPMSFQILWIINRAANALELWGGRVGWVPRQTWQTALFPLLVSDTTKAHLANPHWQLAFRLLVLVVTQGS